MTPLVAFGVTGQPSYGWIPGVKCVYKQMVYPSMYIMTHDLLSLYLLCMLSLPVVTCILM